MAASHVRRTVLITLATAGRIHQICGDDRAKRGRVVGFEMTGGRLLDAAAEAEATKRGLPRPSVEDGE